MTQDEVERVVDRTLRSNLKDLGLAGYVRMKKMLEDGRVIGPRADGRFLWRVRQKIIDHMSQNSIRAPLIDLTDVQAKKLAEDYDKINRVPVEVLFLQGMIVSHSQPAPVKRVTTDDIPMFAMGLVNVAWNPDRWQHGWLYAYFPFVAIPTQWRRRVKKP
jgi:hypothetical protein